MYCSLVSSPVLLPELARLMILLCTERTAPVLGGTRVRSLSRNLFTDCFLGPYKHILGWYYAARRGRFLPHTVCYHWYMIQHHWINQQPAANAADPLRSLVWASLFYFFAEEFIVVMFVHCNAGPSLCCGCFCAGAWSRLPLNYQCSEARPPDDGWHSRPFLRGLPFHGEVPRCAGCHGTVQDNVYGYAEEGKATEDYLLFCCVSYLFNCRAVCIVRSRWQLSARKAAGITLNTDTYAFVFINN